MKKVGLFGEVHTDDDFRRWVRRKIAMLWLFEAAGIVAIAAAAVATAVMKGRAEDHVLGYYMGVGVGLVVASGIGLISFYRTLKSDTRLRRERIKRFDERAVDVSRRAMCIASYAVLGIAYVACLILGLFWYPATQILAAYVMLLLGIYWVAYAILIRRT